MSKINLTDRQRADLDIVTLYAIEGAMEEMPTFDEELTLGGQHAQEVFGEVLKRAHRLREDAGLPYRPHGFASEPVDELGRTEAWLRAEETA